MSQQFNDELFPTDTHDGAIPILTHTNNVDLIGKMVVTPFKMQYKMSIGKLDLEPRQNYIENPKFALLDQSFFPKQSLEALKPLFCLSIIFADEKYQEDITNLCQQLPDQLKQYSCKSFIYIIPIQGKSSAKVSRFHKKLEQSVQTDKIKAKAIEWQRELPQGFFQEIIQNIRFEIEAKIKSYDLTQSGIIVPKKASIPYVINRLNYLIMASYIIPKQILKYELEELYKVFEVLTLSPYACYPVTPTNFNHMLGKYHYYSVGKLYFEPRQSLDNFYTLDDFRFKQQFELTSQKQLEAYQLRTDDDMQQKIVCEQFFGRLLNNSATDEQIMVYLLNMLLTSGLNEQKAFQYYQKYTNYFTGDTKLMMQVAWADLILDEYKKTNLAYKITQIRLNAIFELTKKLDIEKSKKAYDDLLNCCKNVINQNVKESERETMIKDGLNIFVIFRSIAQLCQEQPEYQLFLSERVKRVVLSNERFAKDVKDDVLKLLPQIIEKNDFYVLNSLLGYAQKYFTLFSPLMEQIISCSIQMVSKWFSRDINKDDLLARVLKQTLEKLQSFLGTSKMSPEITNKLIGYSFALTAAPRLNLLQMIDTKDSKNVIPMLETEAFQFVEPVLQGAEIFTVDNYNIQFQSAGKRQKLKFDINLENYSQFQFVKLVFNDQSNTPEFAVTHITRLKSGENQYAYEWKDVFKDEQDAYFYLGSLSISCDQCNWFELYHKEITTPLLSNIAKEIAEQSKSEVKKAESGHVVRDSYIINMIPYDHSCEMKLLNRQIYQSCSQNIVLSVKVPHPVSLFIKMRPSNVEINGPIEFVEFTSTQQEPIQTKDTRASISFSEREQKRNSIKFDYKNDSQVIPYSPQKVFLICIPAFIKGGQRAKLEFWFDNSKSVVWAEVPIPMRPLLECEYQIFSNVINIAYTNKSVCTLTDLNFNVNLNQKQSQSTVAELTVGEQANTCFELAPGTFKLQATVGVTIKQETVANTSTHEDILAIERQKSGIYQVEVVNLVEVYGKKLAEAATQFMMQVQQELLIDYKSFAIVTQINAIEKIRINNRFKLKFNIKTPAPRTSESMRRSGFNEQFRFALQCVEQILVQGQTEFYVGEGQDVDVEYVLMPTKTGRYAIPSLVQFADITAQYVTAAEDYGLYIVYE